MFTDISELMLFSVRFATQISYQNYLEIMLEFFQNLFKNHERISPDWGPGGFLGRWGALPRGQEASGLIFDGFGGHLGGHFGTHLGSKINKNRKKNQFRVVQRVQKH